MNEAITIALSFPTLPLSVLLAFLVVYWLVAATGIVDADVAEGWDVDVGDLIEATDTSVGPHGMAGLMARIGLAGVPLMVSVSLIIFFAWATTYYVHLALLGNAPAGLRWPIGFAVLIGSLIPAVLVTAIVLKPIRAIISRLHRPEETAATLIGKAAVVSTPSVDKHTGRIEVNDGGAGLILQARSLTEKSYPRDTAVVIVSYSADHHFYEIVSKEEFQTHK